MKIALASDHAGMKLKDCLAGFLKRSGVSFHDFGVYSEESVDYPDFAFAVANAVQTGEYTFGILICGTGIGMSIAANKYSGIRAALCSETYSARCAREHNNANVLTMGSRVIGPGIANEIVAAFLQTGFAGGRHENRLNKITELEK
ncbi:MAG: ribose 5-phosphate isomerase B [Bacillota bacterium]